MQTEQLPNDRKSQIFLYVRLYNEQQLASTPPYRQEQLAVTTARIKQHVLGNSPENLIGAHERMMAEYAKLQATLPPDTEKTSAP